LAGRGTDIVLGKRESPNWWASYIGKIGTNPAALTPAADRAGRRGSGVLAFFSWKIFDAPVVLKNHGIWITGDG